MATKSAPIRIESGLSQLVTGSPAALPTGTRPEAIAPTTVPRKKGVSTDAAAKSGSARRRPAGATRELVEREARTPQHDPERGEAERDEQRRHDRLERRRERRSRARPARRSARRGWPPRPARSPSRSDRADAGRARRRPRAGSRDPPPKSAPPKTAYMVTPIQRMTATASALLTPALLSRCRPVGRRPGRTAPRRLCFVGGAPASRHRPQDEDQRRHRARCRAR